MSGQERIVVIKVLTASSLSVIRLGLAAIADEAADVHVIGQACDAREAVALAQELCPDVVLMDVDMPDMTGAEAARTILEACPGASIIVFTATECTDALRQALEAGASGYLLKSASPDEILTAIRAAARGETFVSPRMAASLMRRHQTDSNSPQSEDSYKSLSAREREILPLLAEGLSNQEVADRLGLSHDTIQTYRQRIMRKLDLHSKTGLMKYALPKGIIRLD